MRNKNRVSLGNKNKNPSLNEIIKQGFDYWVTQIEEEGFPIIEILSEFVGLSPESKILKCYKKNGNRNHLKNLAYLIFVSSYYPNPKDAFEVLLGCISDQNSCIGNFDFEPFYRKHIKQLEEGKRRRLSLDKLKIEFEAYLEDYAKLVSSFARMDEGVYFGKIFL